MFELIIFSPKVLKISEKKISCVGSNTLSQRQLKEGILIHCSLPILLRCIKLNIVISMAVASSRDRTKEFTDTVRSLQGRNMNGHAGFKQVRSVLFQIIHK